MNETAIIKPLFRGDRGSIDLDDLKRGIGGHALEDVIAALESTTTTKTLSIIWQNYRFPDSIWFIVTSLCRCISNLRRNNEFHPLCELDIWMNYPLPTR